MAMIKMTNTKHMAMANKRGKTLPNGLLWTDGRWHLASWVVPDRQNRAWP